MCVDIRGVRNNEAEAMENTPHDQEPAVAERATMQTIISELEQWIERPTNDDVRIAAFARATHDMLINPTDSRLRSSIEFMLELRSGNDSDTSSGKKEEPFTAQYAANLLLRSFQHTFLFKRRYPFLFQESSEAMLRYPAEFDFPGAWTHEISSLLGNSSGDSMLAYDLTKRRIQSNVADRYKGPKLVVLKDYADRFDGPIDVLDVGSSLNLGLTKLAVGDSFKPIEVLELTKDQTDYLPDEQLSQWANNLISQPLHLHEGVGVDIMPSWDLNSQEWIKSCSFYPSELLNPDNTAEFDRLLLANQTLDKNNRQKSELQVAGVNMDILSTYIGDFSDRDSMRQFSSSEAAQRKFHLVTFITMMHQLNDVERTAMIDRAKNYLRPGGLIVIQDFMRVNPQAPNCLEFPAHWEPFLYRTAVINPSEPKASPKEVIIWDYGRCEQAILV